MNAREREKRYLDKLFDARLGDVLNSEAEYRLFLTAYAVLSHRHPQKAQIWWDILQAHPQYAKIGILGESPIPIGKINGLLSQSLSKGLKAW